MGLTEPMPITAPMTTIPLTTSLTDGTWTNVGGLLICPVTAIYEVNYSYNVGMTLTPTPTNQSHSVTTDMLSTPGGQVSLSSKNLSGVHFGVTGTTGPVTLIQSNNFFASLVAGQIYSFRVGGTSTGGALQLNAYDGTNSSNATIKRVT